MINFFYLISLTYLTIKNASITIYNLLLIFSYLKLILKLLYISKNVPRIIIILRLANKFFFSRNKNLLSLFFTNKKVITIPKMSNLKSSIFKVLTSMYQT